MSSILKFGKFKGKKLSECPTEYLEFLANEFFDPAHPKFGDANQKMIDECHAVMNGRSGGRPPVAASNFATRDSITAAEAEHGPAPRPAVDIIKEFRGFIDDIYKNAQQMANKLNEFEMNKKNHNPY